MNKYAVTFIQNRSYTVEAENKEEAQYLAFKEFEKDVHEPAVWYDKCRIKLINENEKEKEDKQK